MLRASLSARSSLIGLAFCQTIGAGDNGSADRAYALPQEEVMQLRNRAVLITGASKGLGRALMEGLARAGARVVGVARNGGVIEQVAQALRAQGFEAHGLAADVGDKEAIYPIAGAAAALIGPIDLLIHNASTLGPTPLPLLLDTACEDLTRVLDVNLVGPFRLTKAIVGGMVLRGEGVVMQVSSDAAIAAYPRWGSYSVSKAALDHLSRIWAAELEGTGVRFLSVDPGEMDTQMHCDAIPDADPSTLARPADVAAKLIALLSNVERVPSGSRLEAARLEAV
jgi:NAD(P)-dependent dehydrogenase (short-subunit alcohol dehydrogenase family)